MRTRRFGRRRFHARGLGLAAMLSPLGGTACSRAMATTHAQDPDYSEGQLWYWAYGRPTRHADYAREHGPPALAKIIEKGPPRAPSGPLAVRTTTALATDLDPVRVLAGPDGRVVCGSGGCQMIDPHGHARSKVPHRGGLASLDWSGAHLLAPDTDERHSGPPGLAMYRVPDGRRVGVVPLDLVYPSATEIHRVGSFYLVCTVAWPPPNHGGKPEAGALLLHLPPVAVRHPGRGRGDIRGVRRAGFIVSRDDTAYVRGGIGLSGIVLANHSGVQWTDWALQPTTCWREENRPVALTVGPHDEVALLTVLDRRGPWLVRFDPGGRERFRVSLPPSTHAPARHVFVGDAGRTIVSLEDRVLAFDADGTELWARRRNAHTAVVRLADGGVMYEHDAALWVAGPDGVPRWIWTAPVRLATAPVAHRDRWYVATADTLYELG